MKLSGAQLRKICPTLKAELACEIADLHNQILPLYNMDSATIFHEYVANAAEESGEFQRLTENLNYTTDALISKFGRHRITVEQANQYGRKKGQPANQKAIANILYGGAWGKKQLGNIQPSDGWNFRGSGLNQLTGRDNFTLFTTYYNKRFNTTYTIEQMAELIRTDYHFAIHSACWVFAIAKQLIPYAIADCLKTTVKRINGGLMNYDKRKMYYERAKLAV